jgi:predicted PurR-regulated permease PerM
LTGGYLVLRPPGARAARQLWCACASVPPDPNPSGWRIRNADASEPRPRARRSANVIGESYFFPDCPGIVELRVIAAPLQPDAAAEDGIARFQERLGFLREPIDTVQRFLQQVENFGATKPSSNAAAPAPGEGLLSKLFAGTRNFAGGVFTTVLFLFFLLVSGEIFLLRLVEILPRFSNKRQVAEISQQIESDISAYLVTITIMNAAVGIAMALVTWLTGVGDPILWGTVAFLLNYVPILGTVLGVVVFLLAGLLTIDSLWQALLPAGLYLGVHLIEGEIVTPMLLARRFTLNPVLVVISLVFWF